MPSIDLGLLVGRLGFGFTMLAAHGSLKVKNYSEKIEMFGDPIGVGVAASLNLAILGEFVGSILVILGLFSRVGCVFLISTMSVAFFIVHSADPFQIKELALLFLIAFTMLLITGPGRYSLQNMFKIASTSKIPFVAWLMK